MNEPLNNSGIQASIARLLSETTKQLALFLADVLPAIADDWWQEAVFNKLSFNQQRTLEQSENISLGALDLAALLRIFDFNWRDISSKCDFRLEARNYAKEMQTIRNRWAHAGAEGFPAEDVYRDLDTLQRFIDVIGGAESLIQDVRDVKNTIIPKVAPPNDHIKQRQDVTEPQSQCTDIEFGQANIVCLKSNPALQGPVMEVVPGKPENRFKVWVNGQQETYYASQLMPCEQATTDSEPVSCNQFHAYLTALQIRFPGLSTLYSVNSARVDFIPYQFRPVLRFIRSDRPRLLIADSVGVGKTIEAGLILRELQARRDVRSVLIICPRPLVIERKWQSEMKRFEERFVHLDSSLLRFCINEMDLEGVWPEQYQRVIIPYSLFDEKLLFGSQANTRQQRKGLLDLDPPPRFDLVIVDEAHHVRNQETYSHKAVRYFCDHAEAVVFLTATPIQLGSHDLFVLLNMLRPDLILDEQSFSHMAEPNPYINQAVDFVRAQKPEWTSQTIDVLKQAEETDWGKAIFQNNPEFNRIKKRIDQRNIAEDERIQLIKDIEALHTLSGIINRTRRKDIGEFTIRKPETVVVEFTPDQKQLHDALLQVQADVYKKLHGDSNVKFMMTTIRRQAASCLYGLVPFIEDILRRHLDELVWEEADNNNEDVVPQVDTINSMQCQVQSILEKAKQLKSDDPKLEALRKVIQDKQKLHNNKVMLFSSFRHTLHYLDKHLRADGFRVGMIHGGTPDEDRIKLRDLFEQPRERDNSIDVLLFSEIGCEGLDYQFCDCIVNYDLPWNPMRVEQRIGRIDRKGQKSESVAIVNLITPGTVDADIYERCLMRIGVFNSALGGSEEILGEITEGIKNIAENYTLSDEERRAQLQQLADNKIRLVQEQEALEEKQMELFGIHLPEDQMKKEIDDASSFWLSPASIRSLVTLYLQATCGKDQEFILGEGHLQTLRLSQNARHLLLKDFQQLPKQRNHHYREWENWLKGGNPHLLITFDAKCATEHLDAAFIMPLHPLVKQAAMSFADGKNVATSLKVYSDKVPAGRYQFAVYQWRYYGIREDLVLRPVASSEAITPYLVQLLEKATDGANDVPLDADSAVLEKLDSQHYDLWSEARDLHRQQMQELIAYRKESLATSHQARVMLLQEQLQQADNEKIQRMRQSQIDAAEADYARRMQELDIDLERADITTGQVAYGILNVLGAQNNAK